MPVYKARRAAPVITLRSAAGTGHAKCGVMKPAAHPSRPAAASFVSLVFLLACSETPAMVTVPKTDSGTAPPTDAAMLPNPVPGPTTPAAPDSGPIETTLPPTDGGAGGIPIAATCAELMLPPGLPTVSGRFHHTGGAMAETPPSNHAGGDPTGRWAITQVDVYLPALAA